MPSSRVIAEGAFQDGWLYAILAGAWAVDVTEQHAGVTSVAK